jgi:nucleotide-binding universal stress UspA family protein
MTADFTPPDLRSLEPMRARPGAPPVDEPSAAHPSAAAVPTPPQRVLVPLDGSPTAEAILPTLVKLGTPWCLDAVLLRVVPLAPPYVSEGTRRTIAEDPERLREAAAAYLEEVAERACGDAVRVQRVVRMGEPAEEILAAARELAVDLIAMSTHGRSGLGRLLFGSVTEAVLRRAGVPILVRRVTDGDEGARAA